MLAIFSASPRNEYDRDELIKVREMENHASSGLKVESDHSGVVASGTESHAQTPRKMGKKIRLRIQAIQIVSCFLSATASRIVRGP